MTTDFSHQPPIIRRHAALFFLFLLHNAAAQPTEPQGPYQYARLSPSMAIIVVVLIAAFFFMAFFSIYIRHCNGGVGSVRPVVGARSRLASVAARGLDSSAIEKFPTFAYSAVKDLKIGKGALECAVCLSEFDDHETLRLLPKCDHVFHQECIDAWLASHTTCPVCRAHLVPENPAEISADVDSEPNETDNQRIEVQIEPQPQPPALDTVPMNLRLNRMSLRGSRSGRPRKFPRSHSTGHSLVQPGEDTERFTLRLPVEMRKQIMANRALNRATSMVVLPREGSSRRGYREEGSNRGGKSYRRFDSFGAAARSERWVFTMAPPFFVRESSMKSPKLRDQEPSDSPKAASFFTRAFSIKLTKQAARDQEGTSGSQKPQSTRPPV